MTKEEYIESIVSQIDDKAAKAEFRREIEAHLDDRIAFYTDAGYDYDYALDKAIGRMGDTYTVGAQMNNLYDTNRVNVFIRILAAVYILLSVAFAVLVLDETASYTAYAEILSYGYIYHLCVVVFALTFWLAAKHRNYRVLRLISLCCLITTVGIPLWLPVDLSYTGLASLTETTYYVVSGVQAFTFESAGTPNWMYYVFMTYNIFTFVYCVIMPIVGLLYSNQIKSVISGTAKTNVIKRYVYLNIINVTLLVFKLLTISVTVYNTVLFLVNAK